MPEAKSEASSPPDAKYSKGLEGVIAAETSLSLVDGEASQLFYRGIPIQELARDSSFEEIAYLLWHDRLPAPGALEAFGPELARRRAVSEEILSILKCFPQTAHPMGVLRTMVSVLGLLDPEADSITAETTLRKSMRLTAVFPTLIAAFHRLREGKGPVAPKAGLSHAANFLYMLHGKEPSREMEKALDAYLILLADHGLNASTFAARVTASTQSDLYSAVTSAVGTLKGDLHGSANQRAMEMLIEIKTPENAEPYIRSLLAEKKKVMGFGHRVYKRKDPRADVFRGIAEDLCRRTGQQKWIDISLRVEKLMWEEKKIPCNVDFYSASVLYVLGFPVDFFTTVFAASRVAGWTAHVMEQQKDNRLIRPAAQYVGRRNEHYLPAGKRK